MYDYFYNFYKRETADGLYRKYSVEGIPPIPPTSREIITEDSKFILSEDGHHLITET